MAGWGIDGGVVWDGVEDLGALVLVLEDDGGLSSAVMAPARDVTVGVFLLVFFAEGGVTDLDAARSLEEPPPPTVTGLPRFTVSLAVI